MADRNFAQEAARIVSGDLDLLPQKEHLLAMAAQQRSVVTNMQMTLRLLTALMHDAGQREMHFPKGLLEATDRGMTRLAILTNKDGSVTVRREGIPMMAVPRGGASVN